MSSAYPAVQCISIHALLAESDQTRAAGPGRCAISIHALLAESDRYTVRRSARSNYFYPRSPCGERLLVPADVAMVPSISIHALLAESDKKFIYERCKLSRFLSTLSLRRATPYEGAYYQLASISIHALLAESDAWQCRCSWRRSRHFYPRSPCGERLLTHWSLRFCMPFLSTLSLRRATYWPRVMVSPTLYFYPRSPCGERRAGCSHVASGHEISIHALLAESDVPRRGTSTCCRDFYPRSPCGERLTSVLPTIPAPAISIHALLAESDTSLVVIGTNCVISIHALLAESDYTMTTTICTASKFLSTLSLRRATELYMQLAQTCTISIHALLAESDPVTKKNSQRILVFLSTLSLRRATVQAQQATTNTMHFYPRSPCGERQH